MFLAIPSNSANLTPMPIEPPTADHRLLTAGNPGLGAARVRLLLMGSLNTLHSLFTLTLALSRSREREFRLRLLSEERVGVRSYIH